ncbi:MAG: hypothetical protein ACE5JB_04105 [bacterium]
MKATRSLASIAAIVIGLSVLSGCTSNPFGDDEISGGDRRISGVVQVSQELNPLEGVYVWLESFNIGTKTDEQGNFRIELPPPSSQSTGGVSGVFNLYFYIANFNLVIKPVAVKDGLFVYSQGGLNQDGEFHSPIFLTQALRIFTEMIPDTVERDSGRIIRADVRLQAIEDTVTVFFPTMVGQYFAPLIFEKIGTDTVFVIHGFVFGGFEFGDLLVVDEDSRTRTFVKRLEPGELPVGRYEVIPYLFLRHDSVPEELISSIGEDVMEIGSNYLEIPFIREGGQFVVETGKKI